MEGGFETAAERIRARQQRLENKKAVLAKKNDPTLAGAAGGAAGGAGGPPGSSRGGAAAGGSGPAPSRALASVMEGLEALDIMKEETTEAVKGVRVAAEVREQERRQQEEKQQEERVLRLRDEAAVSDRATAAVQLKWSSILERNLPQELAAELRQQRESCSSVLNSKDALVSTLKKELAGKEEEYVISLEQQRLDLEALGHKMIEQFKGLSKAYEQQLAAAEAAFLAERGEVMAANKKDVDMLFEARRMMESKYMQEKLSQEETYAKELADMQAADQENYQKLKVKLEMDLQVLEQQLEHLKFTYLLNTEKLEYNYRVLTERDNENKSTLNAQKQRLARLRAALQKVKTEYTSADAKFKAKNAALTAEYMRITSSYRDLQQKFRLLKATESGKYTSVLRLHCEDVSVMSSRLVAADRVITEQLLGWQWSPTSALLPLLTAAPPVAPAVAAMQTMATQAWHFAPAGPLGQAFLQQQQQLAAQTVGLEAVVGVGGGHAPPDMTAALALANPALRAVYGTSSGSSSAGGTLSATAALGMTADSTGAGAAAGGYTQLLTAGGGVVDGSMLHHSTTAELTMLSMSSSATPAAGGGGAGSHHGTPGGSRPVTPALAPLSDKGKVGALMRLLVAHIGNLLIPPNLREVCTQLDKDGKGDVAAVVRADTVLHAVGCVRPADLSSMLTAFEAAISEAVEQERHAKAASMQQGGPTGRTQTYGLDIINPKTGLPVLPPSLSVAHTLQQWIEMYQSRLKRLQRNSSLHGTYGGEGASSAAEEDGAAAGAKGDEGIAISSSGPGSPKRVGSAGGPSGGEKGSLFKGRRSSLTMAADGTFRRTSAQDVATAAAQVAMEAVRASLLTDMTREAVLRRLQQAAALGNMDDAAATLAATAAAKGTTVEEVAAALLAPKEISGNKALSSTISLGAHMASVAASGAEGGASMVSEGASAAGMTMQQQQLLMQQMGLDGGSHAGSAMGAGTTTTAAGEGPGSLTALLGATQLANGLPGISADLLVELLKPEEETGKLRKERWQEIAELVNPARIRVWKALERGLQKYKACLHQRAGLLKECGSLEASNAEMRALLQQYLQAPASADMIVGPAHTLRLGPAAAMGLTAQAAATMAAGLGRGEEGLSEAGSMMSSLTAGRGAAGGSGAARSSSALSRSGVGAAGAAAAAAAAGGGGGAAGLADVLAAQGSITGSQAGSISSAFLPALAASGGGKLQPLSSLKGGARRQASALAAVSKLGLPVNPSAAAILSRGPLPAFSVGGGGDGAGSGLSQGSLSGSGFAGAAELFAASGGAAASGGGGGGGGGGLGSASASKRRSGSAGPAPPALRGLPAPGSPTLGGTGDSGFGGSGRPGTNPAAERLAGLILNAAPSPVAVRKAADIPAARGQLFRS